MAKKRKGFGSPSAMHRANAMSMSKQARAEGRAIGGKKAGARTYSMRNAYGSLVRKTLARCAKR